MCHGRGDGGLDQRRDVEKRAGCGDVYRTGDPW